MRTPLLEVTDLHKSYTTRAGLLTATEGVSFSIAHGETLALAGESGCGKSTLGKIIAGLIAPDRGSIRLDGQEISGLSRSALRPSRRRIQMIFQDPFSSLNPRATVRRILEEPLIVHGLGDKTTRRRAVAELMERVGLRPDFADRYPHEFSGGQRQRIGIARALALKPDLVICDEPVSALDVSVRAQILNLLLDLQAEFKLSYLFISHDLSVIRYVANRVAVMYLGRLVEVAPGEALWSRPAHPYTQCLIAANPVADPSGRARRGPVLQGEPPSAVGLRWGCDFRSRCPMAMPVCATEQPLLRASATGGIVACHAVDGSTSASGGNTSAGA
jgi:oligopeptide/dipeptide ABC transporter ATP-binding protein